MKRARALTHNKQCTYTTKSRSSVKKKPLLLIMKVNTESGPYWSFSWTSKASKIRSSSSFSDVVARGSSSSCLDSLTLELVPPAASSDSKDS